MTPCAIVKQFPDGSFRIGSVRSSGYLRRVGAYLLRFYTDPAKIEALIDSGWAYTLEAELTDIQFDKWPGYEDEISRDTLREAVLEGLGEGYVYLWQDDRWHLVADVDNTWERKNDPTTMPPEPVVLTREMVIAEGCPADFFEQADPPEPELKRLHREFAAQAAANKDPNVVYSQGPGFMAISVSSAGPEWAPDDPRWPSMNVRTVGDLRRALERYGDDVLLDWQDNPGPLSLHCISHGGIAEGRPSFMFYPDVEARAALDAEFRRGDPDAG